MDLRRLLPVALLALSAGCAEQGVLPTACVSADETMCALLLTVPDGISAQLACEWALGPNPSYLTVDPCGAAPIVGTCESTYVSVLFLLSYRTPPFTSQAASDDCATLSGVYRPVQAASPGAR